MSVIDLGLECAFSVHECTLDAVVSSDAGHCILVEQVVLRRYVELLVYLGCDTLRTHYNLFLPRYLQICLRFFLFQIFVQSVALDLV